MRRSWRRVTDTAAVLLTGVVGGLVATASAQIRHVDTRLAQVPS
jgi:hypothetical protein